MAKQQSYQELKNQLDEIIDQLQSSDGDIDKAVALHKEGTELIKQLQDYLKKAENEIKKAELK